MARGYLRESEEGISVCLRVSPGAKETGIKGRYGEGAIKLSVAASPEKSRANAEAARFLAGLLGVNPSRAEVVRGLSGRDKAVLVRGVDSGEAGRILDEALDG